MILIIDFGSQYNQLIARRVREFHVYCQIEPPNVDIAYIKHLNPKGIILSGGPSSIYEKNSPKCDEAIFNLQIPLSGAWTVKKHNPATRDYFLRIHEH